VYYPYYNIQVDQPKPIPAFVLKTPPAREPLDVVDVKSHSRIDINDDDLLIQWHIAAVRKKIEKEYNLALITQTWTMYFDFLPMTCIEIPKRPVQSITSVKYLDGNNQLQTLDPLTYKVDLNSRPPRIVRWYNSTWPYVIPQPSAIAVEFIAGYGDKPSDIPEDIQKGHLAYIGSFYENRETYTEQTIQPVDFLQTLFNSERFFSV